MGVNEAYFTIRQKKKGKKYTIKGSSRNLRGAVAKILSGIDDFEKALGEKGKLYFFFCLYSYWVVQKNSELYEYTL